MRRSSRRASSKDGTAEKATPAKRARRSATAPGKAASVADSPAVPKMAENDVNVKAAETPTTDGPSEYELARRENMKRNAEVMASLGLNDAKENISTAVAEDAAQRAKARGLKAARRKPKELPPRR